MNTVLRNLREALRENSSEKVRIIDKRFFKEEILSYGIPSKLLKSISKRYWPQIKELDKTTRYDLFEEMLKSDYNEEAFMVSDWLPKFKDEFELSDLILFKEWIDKYLNNWAKIDTFCNHTVCDFLLAYPDQLPEVISWKNSKNRWMKRASAVSLILLARKGMYLNEALQLATDLMQVQDDMVQKGYGWLLKEESRKHQDEILNFVVNHKKVMPRVALRYAIELMPPELRKKAMEK